MTHWTVRKRIIFSLAAIIFIMVGLSTFALFHLANIQTQSTLISTNILPRLYLANQIEFLVQRNYALTLRHVLEDSQEHMQRYATELQANIKKIDELIDQYGSTFDRTHQSKTNQNHQLFDAIMAAYASYVDVRNAVIQASHSNLIEDVRTPIRQQLDSAYHSLIDGIDALVRLETEEVEGAARGILAAETGAQIGILIGLLVAFGLSLVGGYFLVRAINQPLSRLVGAMDLMRQGDFSQRLTLTRRDEFGVLADGLNRMVQALEETRDREQATVRRVQQAGVTVTSSSTSLAATIREQEATVTEQAASSNQITASTQEIAATSREFVRTIQEVTHMAEEAGSRAEQGRQNLEQLNTTMQRMVEASNGIVSKLQVLNEKAGNINTVVNTITKVADQTNLLSLNAAIEAEKAGEYGRGFSVVATEIRRLADQTAVASWDIEQMLKEMQSAVSASVMGMDKFSEEIRRNAAEVHQVAALLGNVIAHTQSLLPRFEAVHQGMQAQNQGAEQITTAMGQFNESMQQTVESLATVKESVHMLNEAARSLQAEVAQFKVAA